VQSNGVVFTPKELMERFFMPKPVNSKEGFQQVSFQNSGEKTVGKTSFVLQKQRLVGGNVFFYESK